MSSISRYAIWLLGAAVAGVVGNFAWDIVKSQRRSRAVDGGEAFGRQNIIAAIFVEAYLISGPLFLLLRFGFQGRRPLYSVPTFAFLEEYLRGTPKTPSSAALPSFYLEVMQPGLLLFGLGSLLVAQGVSSLMLYALRTTRSVSVRIVATMICAGLLLVTVAAPMYVRRTESDLRDRFIQSGNFRDYASSRPREALAASCWYQNWHETNWIDFDEQQIRFIPDGYEVLCPAINVENWELEPLNWSRHVGEGASDLLLYRVTRSSIEIRGMIYVPDAAQEVAFADDGASVHIVFHGSRASGRCVVPVPTPTEPLRQCTSTG